MSGREQRLRDATRSAAAGWVVRLQAPGAGEADWLAFEAWLRATPGGRQAYDSAIDLWLLADTHDMNGFDADGFAMVPERTALGRAAIRGRGRATAALGLGGFGAAMTAALALFVVHGPVQQARHIAPPATVYTAENGRRRMVVLADGTRLDLAGGSRVSVNLDARARRVNMSEGEVAFAVTHDPARPFVVSVGDSQVRDLGTEFDIRHAGPRISVSVRLGRVEVAANDSVKTGARATDAPISLGAGRQWLHDETTGVSTVRPISADETFAWKEGRLIYRDQPLWVVVDDLNRHFPRAVRIDGDRVAALRFTGVLTVDAEDSTIRRLVALLPISATRVNGATVLKARDETR